MKGHTFRTTVIAEPSKMMLANTANQTVLHVLAARSAAGVTDPTLQTKLVSAHINQSLLCREPRQANGGHAK